MFSKHEMTVFFYHVKSFQKAEDDLNFASFISMTTFELSPLLQSCVFSACLRVFQYFKTNICRCFRKPLEVLVYSWISLLFRIWYRCDLFLISSNTTSCDSLCIMWPLSVKNCFRGSFASYAFFEPPKKPKSCGYKNIFCYIWEFPW